MTQPTRIYKHSSAGTDWAALALGAGLGLTLALQLTTVRLSDFNTLYLGSIDMKKVRGRFRMLPMQKRFSSLIAIVIAIVSMGLTPAYAADERVIDVVQVTWNGATAPIGDAKTVAGVIDTEVNADWIRYTTMVGATTDRSISFKTGKVLEAPIILNSKMPCLGYASNEFMNAIVPEAYKRLGIANYKERYLLIVSPKAGCVWSGRAQMGSADSRNGILVLHDSTSSFVISHELGHTFGLGHSNFLRCENGAKDGAWGENCKAVEYGGTIDVMGNVDTTSPLNTYHQWRIGLIEDSQVKQVWKDEVITLSPSNFANGTKAIFVRDGKSAYWIEYRLKLDGAVYKPGLVIYRLDPPPASAIVSPNPEDAGSEYPTVLGSDVWMLNLDSYKYTTSSLMGGSMTGLSATTYTGNVSMSAVASETGAVVTIKKKNDLATPAAPVLVPMDQWRSPNMVILKENPADADTAITAFEAQIDGIVQSLKASDVDGWQPTYLNPFVAPKTVYQRDLPEGSYTFSMRSIDVLGNKSNWTAPMKVLIDRGHPVVTNDFVFTGLSGGEVSLQWKGATDPGSGICQVNIVDEDGWVLQSSSVKNAPEFKVATSTIVAGTAQVFDCLGNGMTGDISIGNTLASADKSSKTGKWSSAAATYGAGAMKCVGKCTASVAVAGKNNVLVGTGAATLTLGNKTIATVADSKVAKLRIGATIDVGATKKVVRITGTNFVLIGLSSITTTLGTLSEIDRFPTITDQSLSDEKQAKLAKLGFRGDDFSQEWTVLPMGGGTTLNDPSLDLCNGSFASERDRTERRQVVALKEGSTFTFLSTEVVRYSSAAAASAAQKELVKVLAQCQAEKGYKDTTGTLVPYDFKTLTNIPAGVVSDSNRVFVHTVIGAGPTSRTLLGFYQFNGDTFTGLYVMNSDGFTDAQVAKWLKVAVTMANRLQGKNA